MSQVVADILVFDHFFQYDESATVNKPQHSLPHEYHSAECRDAIESAQNRSFFSF
jgi:hypothetical protein